jgi:hypothetical protein
MKSLTFDKTVLERFYNNSTDDFVEILKDYIKSQSEMHFSLKKAYRDGIHELQKSIYVHSSIFCHVGFPNLTTEFLVFEALCKNSDDKDLIMEKFKNLLALIDESVIIAEKEIENLGQNIYQ